MGRGWDGKHNESWTGHELGENYLYGELYSGRPSTVENKTFNMAFFEAGNPIARGACISVTRGRKSVPIFGNGDEIRDNILEAAKKLGAVPSLGSKLLGLFNVESKAHSMPPDVGIRVQLENGTGFKARLEGNQPSNFRIVPSGPPRRGFVR